MQKPKRTFWQIWNMNFGFLGIQFGWALQMANMSAIYEYLGARADQIPILWLAAPLTGLLVQPIIGQASDRTWTRLGRRRPYFLAGATLASLMLILLPNATSLLWAAGMLWLLDASINISMEPFRAFVTDLLPEGQRTRGFAMQSLFIGLGAAIASALPWVLTNVLHLQQAAGDTRAVPTTVRLSFYLGAAAFAGAVLWTVFTTAEYPPDPAEELIEHRSGLVANVKEVFAAVHEMPETMRRLGPVQLFTWLGLFCMWLYFPVAVAHNVFRADDATSPLYKAGIEWGGICFATYSLVCFAFSFILPWLARRFGRKHTHSVCLLCGAAGLASILIIHTKWPLLLSMAGVGIAWASTLSMPYAVLASCLPPRRTGVYMGVFNFFVVIPEILASLFFGTIMLHLLHNNRMIAIAAGGLFLLIASILMQRIEDPQTLSLQYV